jgi:aspartate oxidase
VTSDEDSFELRVRDTLEAGAGLCDDATKPVLSGRAGAFI